MRDEHGVELDNPFYRTRYGKRAVMEAPERKERLLDDNDLELLFTSPLFSGCKSKHRRWEPGSQIIKDALYWVPLLEAFAGLRLEEASQLRRFIADHRPVFKGAETHRGLWPSIRGTPLPADRIASIFGQLTEQHLGVWLSPHCVRYAAATSAALASPAYANTTPLLLGHADPRTAQAYYNLATTTQAQRLTTSTLQEIHAELRDKVGKRR